MQKKNELYHHGIIGQRWGIRRYQNYDGTLTALGRRRLYDKDGQLSDEGKKYLIKNADNNESVMSFSKKNKSLLKQQLEEMQDVYDAVDKADKDLRKAKEAALNSAEFKKIERQLSDEIYDKIGADEWCNSKKDYYDNHASNPKSEHYLWDEDEPIYYLKDIPSYQKADKAYQDAWDAMVDKGSEVSRQLLESINNGYGPYNLNRLNPDGEIYNRILKKLKFTITYSKYD